MFLLDTNVISELRKVGNDKADRNVVAWASGVPRDRLFLSSITILELELGVLQLERRDPAQGAVIRTWLDIHVLPAFAGRVLPVDVPVARSAALLHVPNPRSERDAIIAATAVVHRLVVATRNTADFAPMGVSIVNPWSSL